MCGLVVLVLAIGIWRGWVYHTSLELLPSLRIGKERHEIWIISWFWSDKEHTCTHIITSLGATEVWAGGIFLGNWNLDWLSISYFLRTAFIIENRQGMMLDLNYFMVLVRQRTYLWPHHYELRSHRGVGWWYLSWQLKSGLVEYIVLP